MDTRTENAVSRRPGGEAAIRARIAAAPGFTTAEAHRVAGLVEGECHLALVPNNQNDWRCGISVALREDDRDVLLHIRQRLGLGQLVAKPAHATSQPQVIWSVTSKVECTVLVDLLDAHPFRGRKLAEYEVWREAVAVWSTRRYGFEPGGRARLDRLAAQLKNARRYREPADDDALPFMTDFYARHYFTGFFSGEGCFGLASPRWARFVIKLRRDDRPLLDAFRNAFGIGSVCDVATPEPWSPAAVWQVTGAKDVLRGIAIFEGAGLLGRKGRQFRAWRPGAKAVAQAKIARQPVDARVVDSARRDLALATAYAAPADALPLDPGHADARKAYIEVLQTWAGRMEGPLACTAYQAARGVHPEWPKPDTIAFAFGGWYEALRSAGLESRAARRPSAR